MKWTHVGIVIAADLGPDSESQQIQNSEHSPFGGHDWRGHCVASVVGVTLMPPAVFAEFAHRVPFPSLHLGPAGLKSFTTSPCSSVLCSLQSLLLVL